MFNRSLIERKTKNYCSGRITFKTYPLQITCLNPNFATFVATGRAVLAYAFGKYWFCVILINFPQVPFARAV